MRRPRQEEASSGEAGQAARGFPAPHQDPRTATSSCGAGDPGGRSNSRWRPSGCSELGRLGPRLAATPEPGRAAEVAQI